MIKTVICFLTGLCMYTAGINAQTGARISADELKYDFGTIAEDNGPVSHTFTVKNTGDAPLVITNVVASCGCTRPDWTRSPIAAGSTGEVKVTYDPTGRPGPFVKHVYIYSNGKDDAYLLAIKGNVTPKKPKPVIIYPYAVGPLKMDTKKVLYSSIRPQEILSKKIMVSNDGGSPLHLRIKKHPEYLDIQVSPTVLNAGESGEITVLMNAGEIRKLGRIVAEIPLVVTPEGHKRGTEGTFVVAANVIDDFGVLSAADKAQAPAIGLPTDWIDFGSVKGKGGRITRQLTITNEGRSPLLIRSISCDDERVGIGGGKKEIKPGASATFKLTVRPKEIKSKLENVITIISNDPAAPVRLVKVTAK